MGVGSFLYRRAFPVLLATQLVGLFSAPSLALASPLASQGEARLVSAYAPEDFLSLTNVIRTSAGEKPLVLNDRLNQAALAKVTDMVTHGYWDHFRPSDHKTPWDFVEEAGYDYQVAGENLAKGFKTPAGITAGWQKSPAHLQNIVSNRYVEVGFACVEVVDSDGQSILYTVQMFGSR